LLVKVLLDVILTNVILALRYLCSGFWVEVSVKHIGFVEKSMLGLGRSQKSG